MYKHKNKKSKTHKVFSRLFPKIFKLQQLILRAVLFFLRSFFVKSQRQRRQQQGGFVLPTAVLVLLVMSLVIAALLLRSLSRSTQVIGEHQQQVIYNAASPAIDRARAKLEYLFNGDNRLPSGVPPENILISMMLNDGSNNVTKLPSPDPSFPDPYTLPGETRLDLDGDKKADNAWSYQINANGGQTDTIVAYSILWKTPSTSDPQLKDTSSTAVQNRAKLLEVRTSPLSSTQLSQACQTAGVGGALLTGKGWFQSNAFFSKNFQIDAFVMPMDKTNGNISTLELEQDRQANQGNTWGAWFRNDLEVFPGPNFNWNGAIHTEGSLIASASTNTTNAYLISSPYSCLYTSAASQITVGNPNPTINLSINGGVDFHGQVVNGSMKHNALYGNNQTALGASNMGGDGNSGITNFHLLDTASNQPITSGSPGTSTNVTLQPGDGSNTGSGVSTHSIKNTFYPADIALDPAALFTQNISQSRHTDKTNKDTENSTWNGGSFNQYQRIFRQASATPYVDDSYRADNRYGPKPTYGQGNKLNIPGTIGQTIKITDPNLTNQDYQLLTSETSIGNDPTNIGLDGYWERRARNEGLKIVVGQRLELGNAFGWGGNTDPLYPPPSGTNISNEARQRRSQRDNLAAVQSTAIYHSSQNNGYFPVACLATTIHPGTATTKTNSNSSGNPNFFIGQSTNGTEYAPPLGDETTFANAINAHSGALWNALNNLAYFAGDPNGGAPSYTPVQDPKGGNIHPYPYLAMWGDFSNLRQVLNDISQNNKLYKDLSIADKSYLHTSACTLGLLATNINTLPSLIKGNASLSNLISQMSLLSATSPDAYIAQLTNSATIQLAKQITVYLQIQRDRSYGFSSSAPIVSLDPTVFGTLNAAQQTALLKLSSTRPKYPSLFYLFPVAAHDYLGNGSVSQPSSEPYISDPYLKGITSPVNSPPYSQGSNQQPYYQYQVLNPIDISTIALSQQIPNKLPVGSFRENAFFNGREMLNTRVMDVDLNVLRQSTITDASGNTDTWLPTGGIVYAFREDAVREDSIVRPGGNGMCLNTSQCTSSPTDPTIGSNGITTKPVDYYPDPDRRPYGFRLVNGQTIKRVGIPNATNIHGLSFVSDNAVYIQGDFNYHSTDGTKTNLIEEFTELLNQADWSQNFYTRKTLNSNFAQPSTDTWRPVEILADSTSILSSQFSDGYVEDGIAASTSSYDNQNTINVKNNIPWPSSGYWIRENSYDTTTPTTPIIISQKGNPLYCTSGPTSPPTPCPNANIQEYSQTDTNKYHGFNDGRSLNNAAETRANATIIGAIVPSQGGQSYGGLHNFPRFLENWDNTNLYISGSFLQLNFATSATAPYDQDAWEPPASPEVKNEVHSFYTAPNRLWGYDVGLQYAPAGPVAQRFISLNNSRSEYYQELPANDPYILRLRCAKPTTGSTTQTIDPNVNSTICS